MDHIEHDNRQYRNTLEFYLDKINYPKVMSKLVLNVGCGNFSEAPVLEDVFGGRIVGIDKLKVIEKIDKTKLSANLKLIPGDARSLTDLVDKNQDVVVMRHPEVDQTIFRQCYNVTKKGGILFSTYFMKSEYTQARALLRLVINYQIIDELPEENPFGTKHSEYSGADLWVLVAKKDSK